MRIPKLPPRIGWPLFIIGLLSISISASVYTLFAAHSDGGASVVNNYYEKGKQWNARMDKKKAGKAITMDVDVVHAPENEALQAVTLTIRDAETGAPVSLSGSLKARRPDRSGVQASVPLASKDNAPGVYRQMLPLPARGLWDLEVEATYNGRTLLKSVRVEL